MVVDDQLLVEGKGIYSIEKIPDFQAADVTGRLYLHKTVVAAEYMMVNILKRAKELASEDIPLFGSPMLHLFFIPILRSIISLKIENGSRIFSKLDDYDILSAIKVWDNSP